MTLTKLYDQTDPSFPVTISTLDGDADEQYIIEMIGRITGQGGVNRNLLVIPNGASITVNNEDNFGHQNSAGSAHFDIAGFILARSEWSGADFRFIALMKLYAKTGLNRMSMGDMMSMTDANAEARKSFGGYWADSTTNITSLVIQIGAGSPTITGRLIVYKQVP